jgi:hypothetical protein
MFSFSALLKVHTPQELNPARPNAWPARQRKAATRTGIRDLTPLSAFFKAFMPAVAILW